ncbi:WD repeat-containing protein 46 [Alligator mississippiensis]|uniref:WD repeat-containing protein 46 n=1 Tax=Alligator mississippiensis TaxID=8496 RepID=A0A151N7S1_ALLMI|nr:WD repeat-containing protein 46 [Alligator mississippiensis]KYO32870.1 WD repeat-containing protein 46 [Alligator mississippiensis]
MEAAAGAGKKKLRRYWEADADPPAKKPRDGGPGAQGPLAATKKRVKGLPASTKGATGSRAAAKKGIKGSPAAKKEIKKSLGVPKKGVKKSQVAVKKGVKGSAAAGKKGARAAGAKKRISGKQDPFPGAAPISWHKVKKFQRGRKSKLEEVSSGRLRGRLASMENKMELAAQQAARAELLLPEEPGFLEAEPGEDTCTIAQADIAEAVDIASAAKHFELTLEQFGPYRVDYTRPGRHLLLGGRHGHVAALDWQSKTLLCEINVMESIADVVWLHTETLLAVAQRRWLYVYDNQGVELNCLRRFHSVLRMELLPYHFLLATASETGFLQYLDFSVGKEVATICTRGGRLGVMGQNPANAIIHLGHSNGTVTLWSPTVKEPLVKMLCHRGAVRALAVDHSGTYMATAGLDRQLRVFDLRTYQPLHALVLPTGAGHLAYSQRGLLAATTGNIVQVYHDVSQQLPRKPHLQHALPRPAHGLRFCPFEDVLGVGHGAGFTSLLVPGSGEANFDALENNPFRSRKQRQEWEVKALLEKIPAELITLDPEQLGQVDTISMEQKHQEQVERLGFDPQAKTKFQPRHRAKGRSGAGALLRRKRKVAHEEQRASVRKSQEKKQKQQPQQQQHKSPKVVTPGQRSALERFKK